MVDPNLVRGFRAGPYCGYVSHPPDVKTGDGDTDGEVIVVDILIDVERKESKKGAVSQRQKRVEERSMNFRSLDTLQPSFCFLSV